MGHESYIGDKAQIFEMTDPNIAFTVVLSALTMLLGAAMSAVVSYIIFRHQQKVDFKDLKSFIYEFRRHNSDIQGETATNLKLVDRSMMEIKNILGKLEKELPSISAEIIRQHTALFDKIRSEISPNVDDYIKRMRGDISAEIAKFVQSPENSRELSGHLEELVKTILTTYVNHHDARIQKEGETIILEVVKDQFSGVTEKLDDILNQVRRAKVPTSSV
jgi:hypothetical protein